MYHAASRACRDSIARHGLDSRLDSTPGLHGTYLWERAEQAVAYAAPLGDDVWIVECTGVPLEFGGPFSIVAGERWTPDPIPAHRLRGQLGDRHRLAKPQLVSLSAAGWAA